MSVENLGNSPICFRCKFWEIEPGALNDRQSNVAQSLPEAIDINLVDGADELLASYGKCRATHQRRLIILGGIWETTKNGSLYGKGTSGLSLCESTDSHGNLLFNEAEIG